LAAEVIAKDDKKVCNSVHDAAWKMAFFVLELLIYFYVGFCITFKKYLDFRDASYDWKPGSSG